LIFNPGQMTAMGGIYSQMTAEKGAPAFIVLNNPVGEGEATPGAISDFCTPLSTTTTLYGVTQDNARTVANEAGYTRQTNPAAGTGVLGTGTHMAWDYSQSERDVWGERLTRRLGLVSAVAVLVGSTIGSGIFRVPASVAGRITEPGPFLLAWAIGGLIALCGALTYAELAAALPRSGGVFAYILEAFGPLPAFLFGWSALAVIRASALGAISTIFAETSATSCR
jgi:hypothetical protein